MTIGVKGEHWEATGDGGFRRLIDDETVTNEISWIQPFFEALSLPFERASLNAKVLYGAMAHADEFLVWTDQVEGAGNYPIPVINLPNPARDRYFGVIQGEWRDAVPKIITASESEFDAVFDQAVAAYRANGGNESSESAAKCLDQQFPISHINGTRQFVSGKPADFTVFVGCSVYRIAFPC